MKKKHLFLNLTLVYATKLYKLKKPEKLQNKLFLKKHKHPHETD